MNPDLSFQRAQKVEARAFSRTDLVAVTGVVALLFLIFLPVLARESDDSERAVCLNNMQRIVAAMAMYSTDNSDYLPHPSWGTDLTGPNNWCYATQLPTGQRAPVATGRSGPDAHTNQLPFFQAGQLAPFLESQRVLVCPTDWRESMSNKRLQYQGRAVKLTSYSMSGTVGGYVGPRAGRIPSGTTYKTSDFLPTDILLWEQDETEGFAFNDAASNPETGSEGISRRHGPANGDGLGTTGRAGTSADFISKKTFLNYLRSPRPNELLCGPGYR